MSALRVRGVLRAICSLFLLGLAAAPGVRAQQHRYSNSEGPAVFRAILIHGTLTDDMMHEVRSANVPLAFGLSAALPGAGQLYNRQWIKASVAAAIEVGILWAWSSWRLQGHRGRTAYQATAHQHWSPVRYALWLNDYAAYLNSIPGGMVVRPEPITVEEALFRLDLSDPGRWNAEEQLAIRRLIQAIRTLEALVYHAETGARFSHHLPFFGEQQYYELVGKYFQFAPGWSDYQFLEIDGRPTWVDANGQFIRSIDPEETGPDGSKPNVSRRFFAYAEKHAEANDYLRRASRVAVVFVANHLLAAIDAAVSAKLRKNRLHARLSPGQRMPLVTIQFSF